MDRKKFKKTEKLLVDCDETYFALQELMRILEQRQICKFTPIFKKEEKQDLKENYDNDLDYYIAENSVMFKVTFTDTK